jgi:hypothetical protein
MGDRVIGTVLYVDSRTTEFGTYPILVLKTDLGKEVAVHAFHAVLKREFIDRPPRRGERLGIKFLGDTERGYKGYRVVWEEVAPPDRPQIAGRADAESQADSVEDVGGSSPF